MYVGCILVVRPVPNYSLTTVNDNSELAKRASVLLVRMCGVVPPHSMVDPVLDGMFEAIEESPVSVEELLPACILMRK